MSCGLVNYFYHKLNIHICCIIDLICFTSFYDSSTYDYSARIILFSNKIYQTIKIKYQMKQIEGKRNLCFIVLEEYER